MSGRERAHIPHARHVPYQAFPKDITDTHASSKLCSNRVVPQAPCMKRAPGRGRRAHSQLPACRVRVLAACQRRGLAPAGKNLLTAIREAHECVDP